MSARRLALLALLVVAGGCGLARVSPAERAQTGTSPAAGRGAATTGLLVTCVMNDVARRRDEVLTVHASGVVELRDHRGRSHQTLVDPAACDPLARLLASSEFAALLPRYGGAGEVAYVITAPTSGGVRTVQVADGALVPDVLGKVLVEIAKLRAQIDDATGS